MSRPDVTKGFRQPLTRSGFRFELPSAVGQEGALRLFGVEDSLASPLRVHRSRKPSPFGCPGSWKNPPHFARWLIGLALLAFAIRLVFALSFGTRLGGDALFYRGVAVGARERAGVHLISLSIFAGHPDPTALHPPLFPIYLASWTKLGLGGVRDHQIIACLLGGVTVALIGLLGRRIAGPGVGLIAAGIASVDPWLFTVDRIVNSESLYLPLIVLALLLAYRFLE